MMSMANRKLQLTEQIQQAVDDSGLSRYRIAKILNVAESTMSRFMSWQGGLSNENLNRLADLLDLHITVGPGYPGKAARAAHSSVSSRKSTSGSAKRRTRQTASRGRQKKGK